ncbi:MAG TPA: TlpA disulfide reductase family protein [Myxococcota bacterium]|nr:TlpA disulfide reductase family protein [Myxococcota bacterium]
MDRLLPLIALLGLVACDGGAPSTPPPSRVDAVKVTPAQQQAVVENFCEAHPPADQAPTFSWPELDNPAPASQSGWRWVNIWATWCGPCVEEMPLIKKWQQQLSAEGISVDVAFLSVDAKAEDVHRFQEKHTEAKDSLRVKDFALVAPWFSTVKIDADSAIPVHLFVDKNQKIRCSRMGSVGTSDYPAIKKLLSDG